MVIAATATTALLIWCIALTFGLALLAFLLLGMLRALALGNWRLDQIAATTPRRIGRDGLPPGRRAPAFELPAADGRNVSIADHAGRRVLLVFTQTGCGPCEQIAPVLEKTSRGGELDVLVINNGSLDDARAFVAKCHGRVTVLAHEQFAVAKRYEVFATPFAFIIDEHGVIAAKGIIANPQHIRFLLESAQAHAVEHGGVAADPQPAAEAEEPRQLAVGRR